MLKQDMYPASMSAVSWRGGMYLLAKAGGRFFILDPNDCRDGTYRVIAETFEKKP